MISLLSVDIHVKVSFDSNSNTWQFFIMFESDAACDDVKTYRNKVFPFEQGLNVFLAWKKSFHVLTLGYLVIHDSDIYQGN